MTQLLLGAGPGIAGGGGAGVTYVTWDPATVTAVTLSGGNLVATSTSSAVGGAHVVSTSGKTTGKYYFEVTLTTQNSGMGVAIGTPTSTYTNMDNNATTGVETFAGSGNIYAGGSWTGPSLGALAVNDVIGFALDLGARKAWLRKNAGSWNAASGTANDPVAGTGGITVPAGTMVPFVTSGSTSGSVFTANFGASAFTQAVPSGFTSGWPV